MKPFDSKEMVARVRAVLRRYQPVKPEAPAAEKVKCVEYDGLTINLTNYSVLCDGQNVDMPPKELELLYFWLLLQIRYLQENSFWIGSGAMNTSATPALWTYISSVSGRKSRIMPTGPLPPYGESAINLR